MKYTLNCVSWNGLKEIFHSVSSPLDMLHSLLFHILMQHVMVQNPHLFGGSKIWKLTSLRIKE